MQRRTTTSPNKCPTKSLEELPMVVLHDTRRNTYHTHSRHLLNRFKGNERQGPRIASFVARSLAVVALSSCIISCSFLLIGAIRGGVSRAGAIPTNASNERNSGSVATNVRSLETIQTFAQKQQSFALQDRDFRQFTVRINTWQRQEQLRYSIQHHLTCAAVAQVQIVWCLDQGPVPDWLQSYADEVGYDGGTADAISGGHSRVVIEIHAKNSLNERFLLLNQPPTSAVLSIDDDVLRPCLALESGFDKWRRNPDRLVGFDARSYTAEEFAPTSGNGSATIRWKYAYKSTTEKSNAYAISLTRACFLHRHYLDSYSRLMPEEIRETVATNFNCEDIAMSLWISSLTAGQPPLLADAWAVSSQIKMYVPTKISGGSDHKGLRDECMDRFATILNLKDRLRPAKLRHQGYFEYGAPAGAWSVVPDEYELHDLEETVARWHVQGENVLVRELGDLRMEAAKEVFEAGLMEKSEPWKKRFHSGKAQ